MKLQWYIPAIIVFLAGFANYMHELLRKKEPNGEGGRKSKLSKILTILLILTLLLPAVGEIQNITPAKPFIFPVDGSIGVQDEFITIIAEDGSEIYYSFDKDVNPRDGGQRYTEPIPRTDWPDLPFTISVRTKVHTLLGDKWLDDIVTLGFYAPEKSGGYSEGKLTDKVELEDNAETSPYVSQKWAPSYDELPDGFSSGWGDNGGGRESYTIEEINAGVLGERIVFNSISNSVNGNEKNFVAARVDTGINKGKDNVWAANLIEAEEGETYLIRLFCHNNSPLGYASTAEDVEVRFVIPTETGRTIAINGLIQSSNAIPSKYWDSVVFTSERPFHLEYVAGSALMENNAIGANGGVALDDQIATGNWVPLGYSALNGEMPGCYQYDAYVSIKVTPVFEPVP